MVGVKRKKGIAFAQLKYYGETLRRLTEWPQTTEMEQLSKE